MSSSRLEAFSDAVIAIIITVMVLAFPAPHGRHLSDLRPALPAFCTYALSFVFLGIYWNNHHHMLHVVERVNGAVLWANMHLLFWLSLVPFVTGWMGETHLAPVPTAAYGVVLLMAALAWPILLFTIVRAEGPGSRLRAAVGAGTKEKVSLLCYVAAVPIALVRPIGAAALFILVALLWLVPDRRIERALGDRTE
jgi:uncharacterized membrane protein